jgi:hypothetical protein
MSFAESRADDQRARAYRIAGDLAGSRISRGIVLAILALVQADERTDLPPTPPPSVTPGARQVLRKKPTQEALW